MGIKRKFSLADIRKMTEEATAELDRMVLRALTRLGEECVREARDRSPEASWIDQTGNLRSSIGYVIVRDGEIVSRGGFDAGSGGERTEGGRSGSKYARSLIKRDRRGYTLILVAGMKYAVYVEALTNKDVLATPELYARRRLPELMQRLAESLKKKTKR